MQLAKEQGLAPKIFPIRFVEYDPDDDCAVRAALAPYQYIDFSGWRFESDPTANARLENRFAKEVKSKLAVPKAPAAKGAPKPEATATGFAEAAAEPPRAPAKPAPDVTVLTVDPWPGRADYSTIAAAIDAAPEGAQIRIRPGTYREALRLSKVLELIGEGGPEAVTVTTNTGNALWLDARLARISGMTFRREAGGEYYGAWISAGAAELEDCWFESGSLACLAISGSGTAPTVLRCKMHKGAQGGLVINHGASPRIEDCVFEGNMYSGVQVKNAGTNPTLRRCVARNGKQGGFFFFDAAKGLVEDCEAFGNEFSGIGIIEDADPVLRRFTSRDNAQSGAFVQKAGRGRFEDCTLRDNGGAGISVRDAGLPHLRRSTVSGNGYEAVWIQDAESGGTFVDNDLRGNARGVWDIAEGAEANITRRNNRED